ncbi:MAG: inositol-3-phosphate synthase [Erysipelotrichaceae bacterium]|nr:inositol-3-phosphate synthase [Erysipelotrichaceae bacterium]
MGSKKIRLALIGVGNCSASLVEGIQFYKNEEIANEVGGLMHYSVGGYEPSDIEVVVAFDVDSKKVGKDVSEAIWEWPNCAWKIADVPFLNAPVLRGPTLDGAPDHLRHYYGKDYFTVDDTQEPVDVAQALIDYKVDVILINLPTGSAEAARFYVECAKKAKCGVVNGIPEFLASDPAVAEGCKEAGIPILGDDWKSQIGATIIHRALAKLFEDRGIRIDKSYQLNFAGNTDFINLVMRGETKHVSKHDAIASILAKKDTRIAPGFAFVDNQGDQKTAEIMFEGAKFGNAPVKLQLHLEVEDAPNSGGISIDAVRCCMLAKERGIGGAIIEPSSYFFKHPPVQFIDEVCKEKVNEFIKG